MARNNRAKQAIDVIKEYGTPDDIRVFEQRVDAGRRVHKLVDTFRSEGMSERQIIQVLGGAANSLMQHQINRNGREGLAID